jgi:hypothetical protein
VPSDPGEPIANLEYSDRRANNTAIEDQISGRSHLRDFAPLRSSLKGVWVGGMPGKAAHPNTQNQTFFGLAFEKSS